MRYDFKVGDTVESRDGNIGYIKEAEVQDNFLYICIRYPSGKLESVRCGDDYVYMGYYNSKRFKYGQAFKQIGEYKFRCDESDVSKRSYQEEE